MSNAREKQVRLAVVGAGGRMGCRIVALATESDHVKVTGALERPGHPSVGRDAGIVAGCGELKLAVTSDPKRALSDANVIIDFTAPSAIDSYLGSAIAGKIGIVIGTTALTDANNAAIGTAVKSVPVITAPNMSVGVNLLFKIAPMITEALGGAYDIEIIEAHHNRKKDAPSGTAERLLENIAAARKVSKDKAVYGRRGIVGERARDEIGVHAVRAGDIVGEHTVIFATGGERIELTHRASSRDTFASGALRAAEFITGRKPGLYSMHDVLFG